MRRFVTVAVALIALASGCTGNRPRASQTTERPVVHVTPAAWQAVVNDWLSKGIDRRHSCAAVRAAIAHLPEEGDVLHPEPDVRGDLRTYEQSVC